MAGFQKGTVLGHIVNHPTITETNSGLRMCKFTLKTSKKKYDGSEKVSWNKCVAFGAKADEVESTVKKGDMLFVEGEINYNKFLKDGVTQNSIEITASLITVISNNNDSDKNDDNSNDDYSQPNEINNTKQQKVVDGFPPDFFKNENDDDDIPF